MAFTYPSIGTIFKHAKGGTYLSKGFINFDLLGDGRHVSRVFAYHPLGNPDMIYLRLDSPSLATAFTTKIQHIGSMKEELTLGAMEDATVKIKLGKDWINTRIYSDDKINREDAFVSMPKERTVMKTSLIKTDMTLDVFQAYLKGTLDTLGYGVKDIEKERLPYIIASLSHKDKMMIGMIQYYLELRCGIDADVVLDLLVRFKLVDALPTNYHDIDFRKPKDVPQS